MDFLVLAVIKIRTKNPILMGQIPHLTCTFKTKILTPFAASPYLRRSLAGVIIDLFSRLKQVLSSGNRLHFCIGYSG